MKLFLLLISLVISGITSATTYYISPTGNDVTGNGTITNPWRTLYKATSTVTAVGDIIHVNAGTYTETQTSNLAVGVSIEGSGSAATIIRSDITGAWSSFLELQSNSGTNGNQSISNCTFDGQYVSETNNKTWMGIWITGRSNVIIHDMIIINFRDRGVIFAGNSVNNPLQDPNQYATGNKFYNNTVLNSAAGTGGYGAGLINIGSQMGMEIYNNTMIQDQRVAFKNGWPIKYWENGYLKGCKIYNNILKKAYYQGTYPGENGDWDFAIELFNLQGLEIYNNNIQGCIDLNYNYKGSYAFSMWIHHNTLDHAPINSTRFESGIILEFATQSAIIEDNVINNSSSGIQFNTRSPGNSGGYTYPPPPGGYSALTDNIIRRNLFSNIYTPTVGSSGVGIGIFSDGSDDPYVNNLYIYNNTIIARAGSAPWFGLDFSSQPNGDVNNVHIRNNIVNGFQGAWIMGTSGAGNTNINGMTLTHNDAFGNGSNVPSWPGGNPANYTYNNNLSVNPLFIGGNNFTLQATSPLINAGVDVGLPFSGSAPDIGYAEYGSATNIPPIANAGPDQTITLPINSVTLTGSGTDPDGSIVAYLWTKIAGPAAGTITNPNSATTTVTGMVQGVYRFELRVTDNNNAYGRDTVQITVNPATNIPPTANAGPDQTITLPTNSVTLTGSGTDPDGSIIAYLWTKVAGPAAGTITNPNSATTTVTGMVQGVYRFELRVTDNNNAYGRDTMQVTVNPAANIPPTANAGPDQTITLPTNTVILSGSGTDPDGIIIAYLWTKIAGPAAGTITNPNTAATSVTGMVQGVYQFELRVTDNNNAYGRDTMQVTVNPATNIPPTANAGPDQTITLPTNSVTLSGTGTDPDGIIIAYLWTKIAGPAAGTITNPNSATTTVTGLVQGVYQFELRVTDNNNAYGRDTMQVTVNSATNIPPIANAGPDQTITLPTNSVTLSGTGIDPDGIIIAYLWTKIAGPAAGTITNPNSATTTVTGLVQGVYQFELRVTDNNNAYGRDTMQVTVNPGSTNIPPTANAGPDQSITLPINSVILSGSGTDPDGIIVAYLWTKISGPAAGNITNPNTAATSVTGLVQGVYQFELRVTDNNNAFGRDTMQVTVNPASSNIPPTANAGPNQAITLPINSVILSGSGTDPDGTIVAYLWTKIAGPAAGTITNPNTAATSVTGLVMGVYQFELRVTDNNGAFGRDTMQVTVNASPNTPPAANAGPDQSITLPTNNTSLTGSGSDADGTIIGYTWRQISGPSNNVLFSLNTAVTYVNNLIEGVYEFELTVTDNMGATDRDSVNVVVIGIPSNPILVNNARIYPNPVVNLATLEITTANLNAKPTITITDILGKNVYRRVLTSGQVFSENIDMRNLVKGTYFVTVYFDDGERKTIKIIKM